MNWTSKQADAWVVNYLAEHPGSKVLEIARAWEPDSGGKLRTPARSRTAKSLDRLYLRGFVSREGFPHRWTLDPKPDLRLRIAELELELLVEQGHNAVLTRRLDAATSQIDELGRMQRPNGSHPLAPTFSTRTS